MAEPSNDRQLARLHARLRQLILMRETGPKRPAWHSERMRLIWRLHDEIAAAEAARAAGAEHGPPAAPQEND